MSLYHAGMEALGASNAPHMLVDCVERGRRFSELLSGAEDAPWIQTPSYIRDRAEKLNVAIGTFQKDVWRALPGNEPFSLAFGAWKLAWGKLYKTVKEAWGITLSSSDTQAIIAYEKELDEWKRKFLDVVRQRGGSPSEALITDPTRPQRDEGWPLWAKVVVGIAGGAGALWLIYTGVRYAPRLVGRSGVAK